MNPGEQSDRISQIPLFAALPRSELIRLVEVLEPCEFFPGDLLIREGENDEHFYILIEGEVEVVKALGTPDERLLGVKPHGTLFGEMGLFDPEGRHTASVRARTPIHALEMTRQEFDALLHRHPNMAYRMMRQISRRLEESENATILDLREKNLQLTRAYQELQEAQEQLIIKEKLDQELAIAQQIQMSILPENLPHLAGFDIAGLTYPAQAVGGDYFDIIPLKGNRFGLMISDVCDKGIPAALFANLVYSLMHVEAPRNPTPEATLRVVNRHLCGMNRAGMFVSMLYGTIMASGLFDYCRAGHPHPLVLDENLCPVEIQPGAREMGGGSLDKGKPPGVGIPLGIMEEVMLDVRSVIIPPGGLAVIYSDGLSEAMNASGGEFGTERLAAELPALSHLPAEQVCAGLWKLVQEFSGGLPQSDDFTVVVIKRA